MDEHQAVGNHLLEQLGLHAAAQVGLTEIELLLRGSERQLSVELRLQDDVVTHLRDDAIDDLGGACRGRTAAGRRQNRGGCGQPAKAGRPRE
jgi:hypothetical protein